MAQCALARWQGRVLEVAKPLLRVIVTRPAQEAAAWAGHLQAAGFAAETLSLMGIAPVEYSSAVALEAYTAAFFVSSNAVAHFFKPKVPPGQQNRAQAAIKIIASPIRWMAPGPGTAAALRAWGVPAGQIDAPALDSAQFDSQTLWQQIKHRPWRGKKVLVVCGQSPAQSDAGVVVPASTGRNWLTAQWQAAGAIVDTLVVYQRLAPRLDAVQLQRAHQAASDGSVWLFSSAEAVGCLTRHQPALADVPWHQARALATHPRIATAAQAAGWGVVAMSRPALADVCSALQAIRDR